MSENLKKDLESSPEVSEKAVRRRFTADYKAKILAEAEQCTRSGELGALLRREGLYSSILQRWRQQSVNGTIAPKRRGRKPQPNSNAKELARLKRQNERLAEKLRHAELIIEVQKKISEMIKLQQSENND